MAFKKKKSYRKQKREFLNTHTSNYISAISYSAYGDFAGVYTEISISDCRKTIDLDFSLSDKEALHKFDVLLKMIAEAKKYHFEAVKFSKKEEEVHKKEEEKIPLPLR